MPERVAVVGAAGFLGQALLSELRRRDVPATAIVRGDPALAVGDGFHAAASPEVAGTFDVVVNLAYPTTGLPHEQPALTDAIVRTVDRLLPDGGHLVHVSSLAVFGLALDRPVTRGPVAAVRDVPYVEGKIAAEHAFAALQALRGLSLDVVRLGNIIGPGSGAWSVPLVQKLLTGRPVGVRGRPGLSNATDVANAADYLGFLAAERRPERGAPAFHHLAEFSGMPWSAWIEPLAVAMQVVPVLADGAALAVPASAAAELGAVLSSLDPRTVYRRIAQERVTGSWGRALVRRVPDRVVARVKGRPEVRAAEVPDRAEQTFLAIMSAAQEFRSRTFDGWTPPISDARSVERTLEWLARD